MNRILSFKCCLDWLKVGMAEKSKGCFICEKKLNNTDKNSKFTAFPNSEVTVSNILTYAKKRAGYGDGRFANVSCKEQGSCVGFHWTCYRSLVNKTNLDRLAQTYEHLDKCTQKRGRPVSSSDETEAGPSRTKRKSTLYDKTKCVFCQDGQKNGQPLHSVETEAMGKRITRILENSTNPIYNVIRATFVDYLDVQAHDTKYHLRCLVKQERKSSRIPTCSSQIARVIADVEIINVVQFSIDNGQIISMNDINEEYKAILLENNATNVSENYKKHLTSLITEKIPYAAINRSSNPHGSNLVSSQKTVSSALDDYARNHSCEAKVQTLLSAALILRDAIRGHPKWQFEGQFDNFHLPEELYMFCRWALSGIKRTIDQKRSTLIDHSASILGQHFMTAFRSDRQITYQPKATSDFKVRLSTPLSVALPLTLHSLTRSKRLVNLIEDLHIGESYFNILKIEKQIASAVCRRMDETGGLVLPPFACKGETVYFAIDNIDKLIHDPSGIQQFHGTMVVMNQKFLPGEKTMTSPLKLTKDTNYNYNVELQNAPKPNAIGDKFPCFYNNQFRQHLEQSKTHDWLWTMYYVWHLQQLQCLSDAAANDASEPCEPCDVVPLTWAGFNAVCSSQQRPSQTNTGVVAPILKVPPTNPTALYTALKLTMNINAVIVGEDKRTVVTLDLDLYERAVKLREAAKLHNKLILRIGELHTVFAALKSLGKYIEGSGLEQIWIEKELYGPATVRHLLGGKHYKRGLEAHIVTYLALKQVLIQSLANTDENVTLLMKSVGEEIKSVLLSSDSSEKSQLLLNIHQRLVSSDTINKLESHSSTPQAGYLHSYMAQVENLLHFIRASRTADWPLHLASLDQMTKYFFAHDCYKYARFSSYYLADMLALKDEDPASWHALQNDALSVFKTDIPFSGLGVDHALEQEIRRLKSCGGITGLTQNESALSRFLLASPELLRMFDEFWNTPQKDTTAKSAHYQLNPHYKSRVFQNVKKLCDGILTHFDEPFSDTNEGLRNFVSNQVVSSSAMVDILERDSKGDAAYHEFVTSRLLTSSKGSLWDPIKKLQLKMFGSNPEKTKDKRGQKVTELSRDRALLTRFLLVMEVRPDLVNMQEVIGEYELSAYPRSLFTSDGLIYIPTDKSELMAATERLLREDTAVHTDYSVVVIDGMVELQGLRIDTHVNTCAKLADQFVSVICKKGKSAHEVRVLFDRYLEKSLKDQTRAKRAKCLTPVVFHISDAMDLSYINMKQLLSHKDTKNQLTLYLQEKLLQRFSSSSQLLVCAAGAVVKSNFPDAIPVGMKEHDHEEADTLIPLHCAEAASSHPGCTIRVHSVDTDVYVLLAFIYSSLPPCQLLLHAGKGRTAHTIDIGETVKDLGISHAKALPGLHAFTGADWGGKFAGISKQKWTKLFLQLDQGDPIVASLKALGSKLSLPGGVLKNLEEFVCKAYGSKQAFTLKDLRWELFRKGKEGEKLPPSPAAFLPHCHRSNYLSYMWKSCTAAELKLPSPVDHGWYLEGDSFLPVYSLNDTAPEELLAFVKCGCNKTKCEKSLCSCNRNGLPCTPACTCVDCQNQEVFKCNGRDGEESEGDE